MYSCTPVRSTHVLMYSCTHVLLSTHVLLYSCTPVLPSSYLCNCISCRLGKRRGRILVLLCILLACGRFLCDSLLQCGCGRCRISGYDLCCLCRRSALPASTTCTGRSSCLPCLRRTSRGSRCLAERRCPRRWHIVASARR